MIVKHEHYGASKQRGAWGDGSLLVKAVEDYHASYLTIHWWPHEMLAETRKTVDQLNRRLGYRLQLREISWPRRVTIGKAFTVETKWANAGVAPCYPGGFMALTLKDEKGGIVAVLSDESFNLRDLKPGPKDQAPVTPHRRDFTAGLIAPTTKAGTYDVFVSVGERDGTPVLALPLKDDDGQRRYRLGKLELARP